MLPLVVADQVLGSQKQLEAHLALLGHLLGLLVQDSWLTEDVLVCFQGLLLLCQVSSHLVDHHLVLLDFILKDLSPVELVLVLIVNLLADRVHILLLVEEVLGRHLAELEQLY